MEVPTVMRVIHQSGVIVSLLLILTGCDLLHNFRPTQPVKSTQTNECRLDEIRCEEWCEAVESGEDPEEALEDSITYFDNKATRDQRVRATPQTLQELADAAKRPYIIGAGDILGIQVWHRPELSEPSIIVGPDGVINIPRVGSVDVANKTREQALDAIKVEMAKLFDDPDVTLTIKEYNNNKVFVLGQVAQPGVIHFPGQATLLEAITRAGGIPTFTTDPSGGYQLRSELAKLDCAILRNQNQVIWIDLNELLNYGDMTLNAPLLPNDVIYVPEPEQVYCYVMGDVRFPRAITMRSGMTYLDAVMQAGGPLEDAELTRTYIIRSKGEHSLVKTVNLQRILERGDMTYNYMLKPDDVIFVSRRGIAHFNYYLRQLSPALRYINLADTTVHALE